jgi:hypothetical protein
LLASFLALLPATISEHRLACYQNTDLPASFLVLHPAIKGKPKPLQIKKLNPKSKGHLTQLTISLPVILNSSTIALRKPS